MKFIKDVIGIEYYERKLSENYYLYAKAGDKYKEWDFFIFIFLIFFRIKTAKEDLYVSKWNTINNSYNINTEEELYCRYHCFPENSIIYKAALVKVHLSDGSVECKYFKTNEEASTYIEELRTKFNLVPWD